MNDRPGPGGAGGAVGGENGDQHVSTSTVPPPADRCALCPLCACHTWCEPGDVARCRITDVPLVEVGGRHG